MRKLLAFVFAATASAALAGEWDREPERVFGIPLGVTVAETGLPDCPEMPTKGFYDKEPSHLCFLKSRYFPDKIGDLHGTPDLGFAYGASFGFHQGRIATLSLSLNQDQFERAKAVLLERYGPPTTSETKEVVAGSGARLGSQELSWKGRKLSITAIERVGRVDTSYIQFSDNATLAAQGRQQGNRTRDAASKL